MKTIESEDFESAVLHSDIPVLVDFYTETCGPCRDMIPILDAIELQRRFCAAFAPNSYDTGQ